MRAQQQQQHHQQQQQRSIRQTRRCGSSKSGKEKGGKEPFAGLNAASRSSVQPLKAISEQQRSEQGSRSHMFGQ
jgi:hypothetical protein